MKKKEPIHITAISKVNTRLKIQDIRIKWSMTLQSTTTKLTAVKILENIVTIIF